MDKLFIILLYTIIAGNVHNHLTQCANQFILDVVFYTIIIKGKKRR